jgi:hypothetical protein
MEAYWRDLGKFVHEFAHVEKLLLWNLWQYAGISAQIGPAVLSGTRTSEACSLLNRVFEAQNEQDSAAAKDMAMIGAQIGHITELRNAILHFGTKFSDGGSFLVDNRHIAISERRVREFPASSEILRQATADLGKITNHLLVHFIRNWDDLSRVPNDIQESIRLPWQYKPPQQAGGQRKRRDKPQKSRRQP